MKSYLSQRPQKHNLLPCWFIQSAVTILLVQSVFSLSANAQAGNSGSLYSRSRLNTQAQQFAQQQIEPMQKLAAPEVIKIKLNDLTGVSEWIRAEIRGNQVKLLHTVVAQSGLSRALNSFVPIAIAHTWYDHPTSRISFRPDGCQTNDCLITGTNSITLPASADLYKGQFTLEYTESGWLRTITFKLPQKDGSPAEKRVEGK